MSRQERLDELEKRRQKIEAMKKDVEARRIKTEGGATPPSLTVRPSLIAEPKRSPRNSITSSRNSIGNRSSMEQISVENSYDDLLKNVLESDIAQLKQQDQETQKKQELEKRMESLKIFTSSEWVVDIAPKKVDMIERETQTIPAEDQEQQENQNTEQNQEQITAPQATSAETSIKSVVRQGPEYVDFVRKTSRIMERILNQPYDPLVDYSEDFDQLRKRGPKQLDDKSRDKISHERSFFDNKWSKNRAITSLSWSTRHQELFLGSYYRRHDDPAGIEPEGVVLLWNSYMPDAPEYIFTCESAISCATFYRYHPNIVIGATYSGQLVVWDNRDRNQNPVQRTPINARSHTHPIFGMNIVGTENSHNLITMDTNGRLCSWNFTRPSDDVPCRLSYPPDGIDLTLQSMKNIQSSTASNAGSNNITNIPPTNPNTTSHIGLEENQQGSSVLNSPRDLHSPMNPSNSGIVHPLTYSLAFPMDGELNSKYLIGSENGSVYLGNYSFGILEQYGQDGHRHDAPVTGIDCNKHGPFSDLFLTSSMDWSCKLWSLKTPLYPLFSFDDYDDYVYDVKWSPSHPALFASVDGSGSLKVWNMNIDAEVPQRTIQACKHALNKLTFSNDGTRILTGSLQGEIQLYRLDNEWSGAAIDRQEENNRFDRFLIESFY